MEVRMKLETAKLVTIIFDEALKNRVLEDLREVKVTGFTLTEAFGEGLNRAQLSGWEGKNIRIETLVSSQKAEMIIRILADKYLDKYGMIVFSTDVEVFRSGRFV
jgi:nitrogen regulatory protein P-II 2